jgi:hypothetical protein
MAYFRNRETAAAFTEFREIDGLLFVVEIGTN